jgi:lipooligosaccharide transport system ATP-binding protein
MPAAVDDPALEAVGLSKSYGDRRVVSDLSLTCRAGSVLGLLGPNGAGKTTTLRMLYGFIEPEHGTVRYGGKDFRAHRTELKRRIGVCTQEDTLDHDFTACQNLLVYASYFRPRIPDVGARVDELIERFGLGAHRDKVPVALSGGYKRRLLIARSIVHGPSVLFLDEPTTGLDPEARVGLWQLIDHMRAEGMAIILTTHYMDEAERLSDDMVVLAEGRSIARGRPRDVVGELVGEHVVVVPAGDERAVEIEHFIRHELGVRVSTVLGELSAAVSTQDLARLSERFVSARFTVRAPNLDDLFLQLAEQARSGA